MLILIVIGGQHVCGDTVQQIPFEKNQEKILKSLTQTLDRLRALKVSAGSVDIPVVIRPLLTDLKHELRDLILATLNEKTLHRENSQELKFHILSTLQRNNIPIEEFQTSAEEKPEHDPEYYTYDDIRAIQIEQPPEHPDFLVAMTTFWVMYGEDTSFYLFQKSGEEWQLIAAQEVIEHNGGTDSFLFFYHFPLIILGGQAIHFLD